MKFYPGRLFSEYDRVSRANLESSNERWQTHKNQGIHIWDAYNVFLFHALNQTGTANELVAMSDFPAAKQGIDHKPDAEKHNFRRAG
jgi:hypothetical protein